ncbi:MAG: acyltransferase [Anaerolineales bacterium]|nr:acyltransferase [Anaerolineales bacterium]
MKKPFPKPVCAGANLGNGLIILFSSSKTLTGRLLSAKPLVTIGLISYSAYLWHQPLFAFARYRSIFELSELSLSALALLSFMLAYLSWRFVEQPFRNKIVFDRPAIFFICPGRFCRINYSWIFGVSIQGV